MTRRTRAQALAGWLEAERGGDERAAERALGGLWRRLGRERPSAGFARRTLVRAGLRGAWRGWTLPGPRWAPRGALAAALALMAISLGLLPLSLVFLAGAWDRLTIGAIGLVATVSERLAHGLTAWSVARQISESLLAGLAEPPALAALVAGLTMSFFAFGWLTQLLALHRRTEHA